MNFIELDKLKNKEIIIYEGINNGFCKEIYDFLLFKKMTVSYVLSNESDKYCSHFQDIPMLNISDAVEIISNNSVVIFAENHNKQIDEFINLYLKTEQYLFYVIPHICLSKIQNYSDQYGNEIEVGNNISVKGNISVMLFGYNNKLLIESDTQFYEDIRIELHNNAEIQIRKYSIISAHASLVVYNNSTIQIGKSCKIGCGCNISSRYNSICSIGQEVVLNADSMIFNKYCSKINIGDGSTFEKRNNIIATSNSIVNIGTDCMFSFDVSIINNDGHAIFDKKTQQRKNIGKHITIGRKVWGGVKCTILSGASCGDNVIVGANSVLNKSFSEDNVILAGNPAKVVNKDLYWERYYL